MGNGGGDKDLCHEHSWGCLLTPALSGEWGEERTISEKYMTGNAQ